MINRASMTMWGNPRISAAKPKRPGKKKKQNIREGKSPANISFPFETRMHLHRFLSFQTVPAQVGSREMKENLEKMNDVHAEFLTAWVAIKLQKTRTEEVNENQPKINEKRCGY